HAAAISDHDVIAGSTWAFLPGPADVRVLRATIWNIATGESRFLDHGTARESDATAISRDGRYVAGTVVREESDGDGTTWRYQAARWDLVTGRLDVLSAVNGFDSEATGVNQLGQVVGRTWQG